MRASLASLLLSAAVANAHIALWDKGLFGLNRGAVNYNDNEPVTPLREMDGLSQAQWFGHGYKGFPPNAGDFMVLPAGGVYTGEHACNRAETTLRDPAATSPLFEYACQGGTGALHVINSYNATVDPTRFGGTALAIAYTSDVNALQPNDLTVISVLQQSVWTREASYSIPKDLPACPSGGCICSWNWIHRAGSGEGYPFEIYNLLYRCTVSGATSTKSVMRGQVPKDCTTDPAQCVQGPKTPMYLYQADGNNLPHLDVPPMYNNAWGFAEGAQNDIFEAASSPAPSTGIFNPYASQTTYTGAQPTATSLPKGWQPLGCFVDQNDRALDGGRLYAGPGLTIEMGTKMADDAGYKYAMVENGNELWVGNNAKLVSAPPGECNVRCGGDPVAFCGGSWRGNAFVKVDYEATATSNVTVTSTGTAGPAPTEVLPSGWTMKGCSIDRDSPRALNRGAVNMGNMTNAYCASICQGKGYPYAGTEYRSECWCGDALIFNATSSSDCSEPCSGNSQFTCGGSYRITILEYNANSTSPTTTAPATSANSTSMTTSSTSTANSSATNTTLSPSNGTTTSSTTTISSNTTTSPTTTISSNTTTSPPTTTSSTTTISSNTTTSSTSTTSSSTTISTTTISSNTTTSSTTTSSSSTTTPSSSSTTTVTFATFGPPRPTTTSTITTMTFATFGPPRTTTTTISPTPTSSLPAGYISLGCWKDSTSSRIMPDRKFTASLNTPKYCINLCTQRGYKFAGVENGKECYCASGTTGLKTKATDCTLACAGDKDQKCGNTLSIEVFGPTGTKVRRNKGPGAKGRRTRMRRPVV